MFSQYIDTDYVPELDDTVIEGVVINSDNSDIQNDKDVDNTSISWTYDISEGSDPIKGPQYFSRRTSYTLHDKIDDVRDEHLDDVIDEHLNDHLSSSHVVPSPPCSPILPGIMSSLEEENEDVLILLPDGLQCCKGSQMDR